MNVLAEHPTAIEEIVNTFQSQTMPNVDEETQAWILLEILGAIPEEVIQVTRSGKKNRNILFECRFLILMFQTNVMYSSAERVAIQAEIVKRSHFVINTVQQYILNKLDKTLTDDEMSTLLRAIKCVEAWLK